MVFGQDSTNPAVNSWDGFEGNRQVSYFMMNTLEFQDGYRKMMFFRFSQLPLNYESF